MTELKNDAILFLMLCVLCVSCTNTAKTLEDNGVREINIIDNLINSPQGVKLSTIALGIEYIALETNEKTFVDGHALIYATNNRIVTAGGEACYVFDRQTGSFIRQVAKLGRGPGEYTETIPTFWDAKNEQVCFWGHMHYMFYNIDGTFSHQADRFKYAMPYFVSYENFYVGYVSNWKANATSRIAFYDKEGLLVDSIPNYRSWKRTKTSYGRGGAEVCMYLFNDSLYYKDIYCDTLYQIKDFALHPRYIFNTGGLSVPYEIQEGGRYELKGEMIDKYEPYINITKILEDNRYLYIKYDHRKAFYRMVYDKKEGSEKTIPLSGFENDLDGGLPFWPEQMIPNKEMMCSFTAEQLLALDKSKITDEKLKNLLNRLKDDDNPVIAIVTLKE